MKTKYVVIAAAFVCGLTFSVAFAEEKGKEVKKGEAVEKAELKDWMASFWSRLSKIRKKEETAVPTAVIGLKGAEQDKTKELTPYWKGREKSRDVTVMAEIESLIAKKDLAGAIEALKTFGPSYPDSPLKPVAVLSLAYCYAQSGKPNEARAAFEGFLKDYPNHELAAEAKAGIELLK